jgi:hypothetical protein
LEKKKIIVFLFCLLFILTNLLSNTVISNNFIKEKYPLKTNTKELLNISWWNTDWKNRKKIIIDSSKIDEPLSKFPVLVKLDSNNFDFNKAQLNGEDVRFINQTNQIEYDYEIERWDANNQEAEIWIKLDSVLSDDDTTLWMYYNNLNCNNGQHPVDTWDSHFQFVMHLDEQTGNHWDSTFNGNRGIPYGELSQDANGIIDGADQFDGVNDYIMLPTSNSIRIFEPSSISLWFKTSQIEGSSIIFDKDGANIPEQTNEGWVIYRMRNSGQIRLEAGQRTDQGYMGGIQTNHDDYNDGIWHHIVFILNNSVGGNEHNSKVFVDGLNDTYPNPDPSCCLEYRKDEAYLGGTEGFYFQYNGYLDEIRVSDIIYSEAWIKASYYSESNNLIIIETEETVPPNNPPYTPNDPCPGNNAKNVNINSELSWTGGDPDHGDTVNYDVYFEKDDSTPDIIVSNNQTETNYDVGKLDYNSNYYWMIISWDNNGESTTGPIWEFTTGSESNKPPDAFIDLINPNPASNDIEVSFEGHGEDSDGTIEAYYWESSIDGILSYDYSFSRIGLSYGTHNIFFKVKDDEEAWSSFAIETLIINDNSPPSIPTITGPPNGKVDVGYDYTFNSVDSDGDNVQFYIEWGDGNEWTEFLGSGEDITISHTWNVKGDYTIRAKAKDILKLYSWNQVKIMLILKF